MIQKINKTSLLIYNNHHKNRNRITDVRHNLTAKSFLPNQYPRSANKPSRKQKINVDVLPLESEGLIRNEVNRSKNFANQKLQEVGSTEQFKRYPPIDNHHTQTKIQLIPQNEEYNKFVFPSKQSLLPNKPNKQSSLFNKKYSLVEKSYKKFESHSVSRDAQQLKSTKQKQILYNLPERNQNRTVIFKKTLVLSSMQSCLLELSLIDQRLLITAYLMGLQNTTLRQLYSIKKTNEILQDYQSNFEALCSRIVIQKSNNKYQLIRLIPIRQDKQKIVEEDKSKQKFQIQKQFIKRNFYTVTRGEEQIKSERSKPTITYNHMQAIVQRLSGTKKYPRNQSTPENTHFQSKVGLNQVIKNKPPKPQLIHINKRITLQDIKKIQPSVDQIEEVYFPLQNKVQTNQKQQKNEGQRQQLPNHLQVRNMELNDFDQNVEQAQYQQQFDNPSQVKGKQDIKQQIDQHENKAIIAAKQQQQQEQYEQQQFDNPSKVIEQPLSKNEQSPIEEVNQYEDKFDNADEDEEEVYEQLFEVSKKVDKPRMPPKQHQQYEQQFQS